MDATYSFGRYVEQRRKALDLTREELARRVGCASVTIKKIERDERRPSRQIAELLAEALDVPPEEQAAFVQIARGEQQVDTLPPLNLRANYPSRPIVLPSQPTKFVGRAAELRTLGARLADPDLREITILGPGGIGKTRLALAAAEAQSDSDSEPVSFPDGVYFVGLAQLESAEQLVQTIAAVLNIRFYEGGDPKEQLLAYLSRKVLLLVLDNFEHLSAGIAFLEEMLDAAPRIKLLVTSREKLNRQFEHTLLVEGLSLPQVGTITEGMIGANGLGDYDAIRLFVQTARRVTRDFSLTISNQESVVTICQLVEGMPLGIVLAAGWLDLLTVSEVAAEISRDVDFLATDMADLPERQRNLRAVFDHSWRLLTEREQAIFERLALFRGGFDHEAANAVAGATLRDLQRLANKSLIYRGANGRYQIHNLLQQFAAEKLARSPEVEVATRDRHGVWYCTFLHNQTLKVHSVEQLNALNLVAQEANNAYQALLCAVEREEWSRLIGAIECWMEFHYWKGLIADGESFCQSVIDRLEQRGIDGPDASPDCLRLLATALIWRGVFRLYYSIGFLEYEHCQQLLDRLESAGHDVRQERALAHFVVAISLEFVDIQTARQHLEHSFALIQELDRPYSAARIMSELGVLDHETGDNSAALEKTTAALAIHKNMSDRLEECGSLNRLGLIHRDIGNLDVAERFQREAVGLSLQIGAFTFLPIYMANLSTTLLLQGKQEEAIQAAKESLRTANDMGLGKSDMGFWAHCVLCEALLHSGQYSQARQELEQAQTFLDRVRLTWMIRGYFALLGHLALVESSFSDAETAYRRSAEMTGGIGQIFVGMPLTGLGYAALCLGQRADARKRFSEALSTAQAFNSYAQVVFALPGVALFLAADDPEHAVEIWSLARNYPFVAQSSWFRDLVGQQLDALVATLPSAIVESAQVQDHELNLWQAAAELLVELG